MIMFSAPFGQVIFFSHFSAALVQLHASTLDVCSSGYSFYLAANHITFSPIASVSISTISYRGNNQKKRKEKERVYNLTNKKESKCNRPTADKVMLVLITSGKKNKNSNIQPQQKEKDKHDSPNIC